MRMGSLILGLLAALGSLPRAEAGMLLTPNGNPTGAASANGAGGGAAFLTPTMAIGATQPQVGPLSDDDLLVTALAAQGFNAANGYTFAFTAFAGDDLTLGTYLAWADNRPTFTQGTLTAPAQASPGLGGCNIGIGYAKNNAADPAAVRWINVVEDDNPTAFEMANGVADPLRPGFILSIDNPFAPQVGGKPTVPFYDAGGLANGTAFLDAPSNPLNKSTRLFFHTFAVTAVGKAYTIYDEVTWGVATVVPEPGSIILLAIGGGMTFGTRRRRRRAA